MRPQGRRPRAQSGLTWAQGEGRFDSRASSLSCLNINCWFALDPEPTSPSMCNNVRRGLSANPLFRGGRLPLLAQERIRSKSRVSFRCKSTDGALGEKGTIRMPCHEGSPRFFNSYAGFGAGIAVRTALTVAAPRSAPPGLSLPKARSRTRPQPRQAGRSRASIRPRSSARRPLRISRRGR